MEAYLDVVKRIIYESDLVLDVLDARLVEYSRNEQIENLINEIRRPVIFVINKSDLVSKQSLKKQIEKLKKEIKKGEVVFVSSKNKKSANILLRSIKRVFKKYGKCDKENFEKYEIKNFNSSFSEKTSEIEKSKFSKKNSENKFSDSFNFKEVEDFDTISFGNVNHSKFSKEKNPKYREARGDIVVGVLGYPNVGKSSVINLLAHKKKAKVGKEAGTTHGIHWIRISKEIKLIDSPGIVSLTQDNEIRYGLIGARDSNSLKNPDKIAEILINLFLKNNKKEFEEFYGIKIKSDSPEDIIKQISEKKFYFLKGGKIDENKTIFMIIRDWNQGKLRL